MPYCKPTIIKKASAEYAKGSRTIDLARKYKVPLSTLTAWLKDSGVAFRPKGSDKRIKFDVASMVAEYMQGLAVLTLASRYSVSRATICMHLKEQGIKLRTASEQAWITASKTSKQEKARRVAFAHAAIRGRKKSTDQLLLRARGRQFRGEMTAKEADWRQRFADAGIVTVPQYAVGKFTIDLAVPDARVAIEVKSGWSYTGDKRAADAAKNQFLESNDWVVLDVAGTNWSDCWPSRVAAVVEQRRAQKLR